MPEFNRDPEWLRRRADAEDRYVVSVGGLLTRVEERAQCVSIVGTEPMGQDPFAFELGGLLKRWGVRAMLWDRDRGIVIEFLDRPLLCLVTYVAESVCFTQATSISISETNKPADVLAP
jgi:hypothetical protein